MSRDFDNRGVPSNGLHQLGGNWSEDDFREFEEAAAQFEEVDEELSPASALTTGSPLAARANQADRASTVR